MDPISISSAIAGFLTLSGSSAKTLRRIVRDVKDAPEEILAISNELSDLSILLSDLGALDVDALTPSPEQTGLGSGTLLLSELQRARKLLAQLEASASELFDILPDGKLKFHRFTWTRKKPRICLFQQELVGIKRNLTLIFASATASHTARIEVSLRGVQLHSQTNQVLNTTTVASLPDAVSLNLNTLPAAGMNATAQQMLPTSVSHASAGPSTSGAQNSGSAEWSQDGTLSTFLQTVRQVATFGTMTFHVNRLARCEGDCQCICHNRSIYQSPRFLDQVLGQLFVGYAGLPVLSSHCDMPNCSNQYRGQMQVSYTFPGWLLHKTVNMVAAMTHNNEPSFGLTVKNRTTISDNDLFKLARQGNTDGIIELFKQRRASPNDITAVAGQTPIHFALELGHIRTCEFLLNIGVDPYIKNDRGHSDAQEISTLLLSNQRSTSTRAWNAEAVFRKVACEHSELWDFTFIHSIVVGILHVNLEDAVSRPEQRSNIDKPDLVGRTPLWWASLRGDHHAIKVLLRAGARITTSDDELRTPLHAAIISSDIRSVELLLMAGSSVYVRDIYGDTAINIAAWADDNPAVVEMLYLAGASVDASNKVRSSPLQSAACVNHPKAAEYLIDIGATIDWKDHDDDTPLLEAMRYENTAMVEVLIRRGASLHLQNHSGQSALHVAAQAGNAASIRLLAAAADLSKVHLHAEDAQGRTALDCFNARTNPSADATAAFRELVAALTSATDDEGEEGDFHDAVETLD